METVIEMTRKFIVMTPSIAIAIYVHELSHFFTAKKYTVGATNWTHPGFVERIDPVGLLMYYFFLFGWSRPYPINYWKLRKVGIKKALLTTFSGPISNFIIGLSAGLIFYLSGLYRLSTEMPNYVLVNPILNCLSDAVYWVMVINLNTSLFNLIPIPPLDGANIVTVVVPEDYVQWLAKYEIYGIILLLVLSLLGIMQLIMWPVTEFVKLLSRIIV